MSLSTVAGPSLARGAEIRSRPTDLPTLRVPAGTRRAGRRGRLGGFVVLLPEAEGAGRDRLRGRAVGVPATRWQGRRLAPPEESVQPAPQPLPHGTTLGARTLPGPRPAAVERERYVQKGERTGGRVRAGRRGGGKPRGGRGIR